MKIVGIQSSPRGKASNTLKLLDAALEGAREAGAGTELVDITRVKINFCKGDSSCYRTGACFQDDDYAAVREKILAADGIILSSPNYIDNVPAQLKVFFDRSANFIHEQYLDGKYGFAINTSGSEVGDLVLNMMSHFITHSGGLVTGGVIVAMARGPGAMEAAVMKSREMGSDLVNAIKEKRAYPGQTMAHQAWKDRFGDTVRFNKESWIHNYEHWVKKGWIKA